MKFLLAPSISVLDALVIVFAVSFLVASGLEPIGRVAVYMVILAVWIPFSDWLERRYRHKVGDHE